MLSQIHHRRIGANERKVRIVDAALKHGSATDKIEALKQKHATGETQLEELSAQDSLLLNSVKVEQEK